MEATSLENSIPATAWTLDRADRERGPILHPLAGSSFRAFLKHYFRQSGYSARSRPQRLAAWLAQGVRSPTTVGESLWWGGAIRRHALTQPPVFLLGHWRSGTTHLHNLLSKDPRFGFIDFGETVLPLNMLGRKAKLARGVVSKVVPPTRGYDNVKLSMDQPQEEEMALGNLNPICYFNVYYFPRQMEEHARKALFLEGTTAEERAAFERAYAFLLRKLSYARGGKRLLLKNPASTARIPMLKRLFPGAKFVHIARNPYPVYRSSINKFPRLLSAFSWQDFMDLDFHDFTIRTYESLMRRYLEDRAALPEGDLHETTYESLTADPMAEIARLYGALGIEFTPEAEDAISRYAESIADYEANVHRISAAAASDIRERWKFAFEAFGYPMEPPPGIAVGG